ncbi:MAG: type II toxin-antitoxin system prevent-host-death family antitoxin [Nitriliruptorales bacterium]|nr:type II toxin-antitoxin system prevent-host-death family antitoxin [Nitriliruptorales bacterium]
MVWQLQEAKQRFSELVERARSEGAQVVTRRGREVVVVLAIEQYRDLTGGGDDFKDFLLSGPDLSQLDMARAEQARPVEL